MNVSVYIAKRYLFSRKKMHVINVISGISMLGVLISSAAFIIVLSGFNGLEKVILSSYSNFSPEIKIEPRLGKTFDPNTAYFNTLCNDPRIFSYTDALQEKAVIKYNNKPFIGTIRGLSDDFLKNTQLDSTIQSGSFTLKYQGRYFAVVGSTVQGSLDISVRDHFAPLEIYSPKRTATSAASPLDQFVVRTISPSGVFAVEPEFDDMVIAPIEFVRDLLDQPVNVSSIEINFKKGTDLNAVQEEIQQNAGNDFIIKNRSQQNVELYKTLNYERWFVYMILTFVLIIAIFNIIGSLTMLVIDKQKDIAILTTLGANKRLIQGIFFFEGMMISFIGCITGVFLGTVFCILQQNFGLVKIGTRMSVLEAYPVAFRLSSFALVFFTVGIIAIIASGISARLSVKGLNDIKQDL